MSDKTEKVANAQTATEVKTEETPVTEGAVQNDNVVETETKKKRRGLSTARGTQRLRFSHELVKGNGLFLGHLNSVEVTKILIGEDKTGTPSFNGLEIPKIIFTFASNEDDVLKRHYQTLQFTAVESTVKTIVDGDDAWKVDAVLNWLKHILDVYYFKGKVLTDAQEDALSLDFDDTDDNGDYSPVEPEVVIEAWKLLFENVEQLLNRGNEGKPAFKTKEGKLVAIWMKLLRYIKNNKKGWQPINNGDLAFPTFIGEGCIEIMKQNVNPSIRLDIVKEAILPMNIEKAKTPTNVGNGIPSMNSGMMGGTGGPAFNNMGGGDDEDMPF